VIRDSDGEYFGRVVLASRGVKFAADAKCYYRSDLADASSGNETEAGWAAALLSTELKTTYLLAAEDSPRTRRACAANFLRLARGAYPRQRAISRQAEERVCGLGGARLPVAGGPALRALAAVIGWKPAYRLRALRLKLRARGPRHG